MVLPWLEAEWRKKLATQFAAYRDTILRFFAPIEAPAHVNFNHPPLAMIFSGEGPPLYHRSLRQQGNL
jgi:hypothetical protein